MRRDLGMVAILTLVLLTLVACGAQAQETPAPAFVTILGTPVGTSDQATLAAALTQEKNNADYQAVATAEIVRANAQATLNSANATLSAVQTQEQSNADVIAAHIAATAEIVRANAQATLVAAGSTQNAALTQDAIRQTQMANQQNRDELAAGTQTAIANNIATQTQVAVATSQWYIDQTRQRKEQWQWPVTLLWMCCLPTFIVLFAGLTLWGFWRWLRIRQANQRILENPVDQLPVTDAEIIEHHQDDSVSYLESDIVDDRQTTTLDDQVRGWLDEIKRKLLKRAKDDDDNPGG
jgi:hypothetical protein